MKGDFEQAMRDRMEDASLTELMPEFDKQAEWSKLSGKLQPGKNRILMPLWSYAAGILALILAGWFWTKYRTPEQNLVKNTPTRGPVRTPGNVPLPNNPMPAPGAVYISTPVAKQMVSATREPKTKQADRIKTDMEPLPIGDTALLFTEKTRSPLNQQLTQDSTHRIPALPEPKEIATLTKKTRPHAVNVLDIDNEDRQYMITEAPVGTYANPFLAKLHSVVTQDGIAGSDKYYPLQGVFKK